MNKSSLFLLPQVTWVQNSTFSSVTSTGHWGQSRCCFSLLGDVFGMTPIHHCAVHNSDIAAVMVSSAVLLVAWLGSTCRHKIMSLCLGMILMTNHASSATLLCWFLHSHLDCDTCTTTSTEIYDRIGEKKKHLKFNNGKVFVTCTMNIKNN